MDTSTLRILDASLNRAGEGLRVVEDYARFCLDDGHLSGIAKNLRHDLAAAAAPKLQRKHAARDTRADVGASITTDSERSRATPQDVCIASLERTKQALRSLEEYGKTLDAEFAASVESIRYRLYTLEKALLTTADSIERLEGVKLYVLVDGRQSAQEFSELVGQFIDGGVHVIQLRDKRLDDRGLLQRARSLVELTSTKGTLAIVNDRPDIAAAAHADGVHLGQDDLSVKDARSVVGPRALVGVSTHNLGQARQAVLDGADYLGAGPTFPSGTKQFDAFAGLDYLKQVAAEVSLPTFAIGGISVDNLSEVLATGMQRVAVSGAVTQADDPKAAVAELLGLLRGPQAAADG